jgi:hypothetical protein
VEVVHDLHAEGVACDFSQEDVECDVRLGELRRREFFVVHSSGDAEESFFLGAGDPFRRKIGGGGLDADAELDDIEQFLAVALSGMWRERI